jgi:hypothetical protein
MKPRLVFAAFVLAAGTAGAQVVWRCGADGREYRDAPCTDGRVVAVADTRSQAEREAAADVVARDRALARQLAQERREMERERRAAGNGLAGFVTAAVKPKAAPAARPPHPKRPRPADGDTWRAADPSSRFAKG